MQSDLEFPTYERFNDYYDDARAGVSASYDGFHVLRLSELGDELVTQMGPFRPMYFQFAIGAELHGRVDVFETQNISESYSAVIYLPGQIIQWEKTGRWDGYVINVQEEFLNLHAISHLTDSYAFLHSLEPLVFRLQRQDYLVLARLCELMLVEQAEMREENMMVIRNLMQVYIVYVNRILTSRSTESDFAETHYQEIAVRFKSLALLHYQSERSVSHYADALDVTPAYLTTAVKRVYNRTPKQVINEIVLLHAKTALSSSSRGIKEVAFALKFEDYSHFSKFFRKMMGVSPSEYRDSIRGTV